jgi:cysteine desulfurase family protein
MKQAYFNNAATSYPKPEQVIEAVNKCLRAFPHEPYRSAASPEPHEDVLLLCRKKLAKLFNVKKPELISFTSGATESLNLAIAGLELGKAHVISTCIEHNSVIRPLCRLEKENGLEISFVSCDSNGIVNIESFGEHLRDNTKAVVINHRSNVTGLLQDLKKVSEFTKKHNLILIVDASQSAGQAEIDIEASGIDMLAFTGHKYLYGIMGTGGIYVSEKINLKPLKTGGTGIKSQLLYQPMERPLIFEAGTPNMPGVVSLSAGLDFIESTGIDKIRERKKDIILKLGRGLLENSDAVLYPVFDKLSEASLFSFNIKGIMTDDLGYMLEKSFGLVLRSGLHCAPLIHKCINTEPHGSIRVSPSYFTSDDDIEQFISAIKNVSRCIK